MAQGSSVLERHTGGGRRFKSCPCASHDRGKGGMMSTLDSRPSSLWICQKHRGNGGGCLSCNVAINHNVTMRQCHCGEKATGYRTLSPDVDVEFFCDEHFQGVLKQPAG